MSALFDVGRNILLDIWNFVVMLFTGQPFEEIYNSYVPNTTSQDWLFAIFVTFVIFLLVYVLCKILK